MKTSKFNVETATTAELLEFFNAHSDKQVKRFADRATAIRRVTNLILDQLPTEAECGVIEICGDVALEVESEEVESEEVESEEVESEEVESEEAARSNLSIAIEKSWTVAEFAAKRAQRSAVDVDGFEYRSVQHAYECLEMDPKNLIRFRMLLKRDGKLEDEGRTWTIIPLNY
jgi:hypothetical protein